jgi:two-component system response regulator DesR
MELMSRPALLDGRKDASSEDRAVGAAVWKVGFLGGSALLREALGWWLSASGNYEVVGSYPSIDELLAAEVATPDLLLVDLEAVEADAGARLRAELVGTRIVLLADAVTSKVVRQALRYRVEGVLLTSDVSLDVLGALEHVMAGRVVYPAGWQDHAMDSDDDPLVARSARQREVLELVSQGCRNDEIAQRLFVSYNTVKFHMHEIYARLGVRNRVEAAQLYLSARA